jgi:hypothetical protein
MTRPFGGVRRGGENLKIGLHVKPADALPPQRHYMVDVVLYSGFHRQARRLAVDSKDRVAFRPCWRRLF